jgi:hypothetical protein
MLRDMKSLARDHMAHMSAGLCAKYWERQIKKRYRLTV